MSANDGPDFIMDFVNYTKRFLRDTPEMFRRWCAISMVASALERRVWTHAGGYEVFPNMYLMLIAPSGHGKFLITHVKEMLREATLPNTRNPAFRMSPDNMTKASLIDAIAKAEKLHMPKDGGSPFIYHALSIYSEDINAWMSTYDSETFGALLSIWNNLDIYQETRRTSVVKEHNIVRPTLNLLVGIQPFIMGSLFPDEAWYTGFTRRTLMVYSYEPQEKQRLSNFTRVDPEERKVFLDRLGQMALEYGEVMWQPEAFQQLDDWDFSGGKPVPQHSKLEAYLKSRTIFVEKLAMISAASMGRTKLITTDDVDRAIFWLTDAETTMPDIFRAMRGKSDASVMEEVWRFVQKEFGSGEGVPSSRVRAFMLNKCPGDKVDRLFNLAISSDLIRKVNGSVDDYMPGPKGPGEF